MILAITRAEKEKEKEKEIDFKDGSMRIVLVLNRKLQWR